MTYSARDAARVVGLSEARLRACVRAGFLEPARGPHREMRFSFQDLVLLRTAKGLLAAEVSPRRVRRALTRLRAQLPPGSPLTGVHIAVEGDRIVVRDGHSVWQPESGQALLDFGVAELRRRADAVAPPLSIEARRRETTSARPEPTPAAWFAAGCEAEARGDRDAAGRAYGRALELDAGHADAHVNLGRLRHEDGDVAEAEEHYRRALAACPEHGTAAFNLGVALEDRARLVEALEAYQQAARLDPDQADAHFNAARLAEKLGRETDAIRHLNAYRKLVHGGR